MDKDILRGNFEVKRKVTLEDNPQINLSSSEKIAKELKEAALQAIGGSMVYVERTHLEWDGESGKSG